MERSTQEGREMGIASGWQKKSLEMTSEMSEAVRRADAVVRGLSRSDVEAGRKMVGSKIWAATEARGIMTGIITDAARVNELLAILRG